MISNFVKLLKARAKIILLSIEVVFRYCFTVILFLILLSSCASIPNQTNIKKEKLYKCDKVAVNVSAEDIDIKYSRDAEYSIVPSTIMILSPLLGLVAMGAESSSRSHHDKELSENIRDTRVKHYFETLLKDYFLDNLKKANIFKTVIPLESKKLENKMLLKEGYDTLIELTIKELSFRRDCIGSNFTDTEKLIIYIDVWGKMIDLQKEEVIWNRQEIATSDERFLLESIKEDGGRILKDYVDKLLRKTAFRLANDIIYAK